MTTYIAQPVYLMHTSIKAIFDVGKKMQQALKTNDLDGFYTLVDERENLIAGLKKKNGNLQISEKDAAALEKQFQLIIETLNQKEQQMIDQLNQLDQFRKAGRSYHAPQNRRQFIRKNLMG